MSEAIHRYEITKYSTQESQCLIDEVTVEEPLQIIIDGRPLAVLMRTPGQDEFLVLGFLLTEAIITKASEVRRIDLESKENHALVFLDDGHQCDWQRLTRHLFSASSCGLCGKATVEAILQNHPPILKKIEVLSETILQAPQALRTAQREFSTTGGIHASGLFSLGGELLILHEDVGRHNALDKVIGESLRQEINTSETFLLVSGRISFELMQKSLAAKIPLVAGISAPSSLAIDFAKESGQSLFGFVRPPTLNRYA